MEVANLKNHEQLYFADGNIVLVAQNAAAEPVAFRVHQSIMARNSPVFADMLSLPPSGAMETYDGVPLVRMPDPAEDLQRLLEVLYIQPMMLLKRFDPNTPIVVKPLLTLANKYEIQYLQENIIQKLEEDWPQTLDEWDELEQYAAAKANTCAQGLLRDQGPNEYPDLFLPEPASAIHLSRHCNVPNILPAAFYHLSRISIEHDWDRTHILHHDDTPDYEELLEGARTARWNLISREDFVCVLLGRERLKRVADYHYIDPTGLRKHPHVNEDREDCKSKAWSKVWGVVQKKCDQSSDVLKTLSDVDGILKSAGNPALCWLCDEEFRKRIDKLRRNIWNDLHDYFDLPPRA